MIFLLIVIIVLLIGGDQLMKYWVDTSFTLGESRDFIKFGDFEVFDLTYIRNDGAVFGSMSGQRWFLIGFTSIVIIAGIYVLFRYMRHSKVLTSALVLFISGGIGNLIDRIRFGSVVDMFEFKIFEFAIFNIADIYVVFAIILLFVYVIFIDPKLEKKKKESSEAAANE